MALLWLRGGPERWQWERLGVSATAVFCSAYIWANPWHACALMGADPAQLSGLWRGSVAGSEGTAVLSAAALAAGFCACVPVRVLAWPAIPTSLLASYAALVACVGSADATMVAPRLCILAALLLYPVGAVRREEARERESWLSTQTEARTSLCDESDGKPSTPMRAPASAGLDVTLHLSDACAVTRTSSAPHDPVFGRAVEGKSFTSFLARGDRHQFQQMIDEVSESGQAASFTCTMNLPQGPVKVCLSAENGADSATAPEASFTVGIRILDVGPRRRRGDEAALDAQGPHHAGALCDEAAAPRPAPPHEGGVGPPASAQRANHDIGCGGQAPGCPGPGRDAPQPPGAVPLEGPAPGPAALRPADGGRALQRSASGVEWGRVASVPEHAVLLPPVLSRSEGSEGSGAEWRKAPSHRWTRSERSRCSSSRGTEESWMVITPSDRSSPARATEASFWLSESSCGAARPVPTVPVATQTARAAVADAGVGTDLVMDGFSFRCLTCARPPVAPKVYDKDTCAPVLPGPQVQAIIAKLDRKKGVKRSKSQDRTAPPPDDTPRYFKGAAFDGEWEAMPQEGVAVNEWLRVLSICRGHVILGDLSEVQLVQLGKSGPVLLRDGELRLTPAGLCRQGRSGFVVSFVWRGRCDQITLPYRSSDSEDSHASIAGNA